MNNHPYKSIANIIPLDIDKDIIILRQNNAYPFQRISAMIQAKDDSFPIGCLKCGISAIYIELKYIRALSVSKLCYGINSFWDYLLFRTKCHIKTAHFHVLCNHCNFKYIMAPKDKEV